MDVSQYLEIFIDESAEHLQTLSDCIMELEKEPDNKDVINEIFRAAHSLKKEWPAQWDFYATNLEHIFHIMCQVLHSLKSHCAGHSF